MDRKIIDISKYIERQYKPKTWGKKMRGDTDTNLNQDGWDGWWWRKMPHHHQQASHSIPNPRINQCVKQPEVAQILINICTLDCRLLGGGRMEDGVLGPSSSHVLFSPGYHTVISATRVDKSNEITPTSWQFLSTTAISVTVWWMEESGHRCFHICWIKAVKMPVF